MGVGGSGEAVKPKHEPETQPFISQGEARGGPWELFGHPGCGGGGPWGYCLYISNILLHGIHLFVEQLENVAK